MTIELIVIGKTDSEHVAALVAAYSQRINRYIKFSVTALPDVKTSKKLPEATQKQLEGEAILRQLSPGDFVVLLDERGSEYGSVEFSSWLEHRMAAGGKRICFVIGGPYGFSNDVHTRADERLSLSRMTFSHQIVRAIFAEQLYRAFTIIHNEPYHHA